MGPDLLGAFAWGWSAHLLLGEQPFPQRATRESSHRLKVSIALRTPSEYGEFDGCTPLNSVSTPLADELDERGHPTTYSGPTERCLHSIAEGGQRGPRRPRDAKAASVEAASACPYAFSPTDGSQRPLRRHRCGERLCVHRHQPAIPHVAHMRILWSHPASSESS